MKPRTMILMVVAVGCGLAASYMTSKLLAERKQPEKPPDEKVKVLIAKAKVLRFTVLKEPEKFFEVKERLKSEAPKSYFSDFSEIKDKKLNKDLKVDSHVSPEDIQDKMLAELDIPPGLGAIAIRVANAAQISGGFLKAKDKVDVILTVRGEHPLSQIILQEVLVLAVGDKPNGTDDGEGPVSVRANNVTLALNSEEAQLVTLAQSLGDLSLFLRKDGDTTGKGSLIKVTKPEDLLKLVRRPKADNPEDGGDKLPENLVLPPIGKPGDGSTGDPKVARPDWILTIRPGGDTTKTVPYFKQPDGTVGRTVPEPEEEKPTKDPKQDPKKPTKEPEKQPAP